MGKEFQNRRLIMLKVEFGNADCGLICLSSLARFGSSKKRRSIVSNAGVHCKVAFRSTFKKTKKAFLSSTM